jgi:hypothetical protein
MILWFNKDNPEHFAAECRLQNLKADLTKMRFEFRTTEARLARSESNLEGLDYSLDYLRNSADIVSMREFQNIQHQRVYELHAVISDRKLVPQMAAQIKIIEAEIARIEGDLPSLRSKVLEFKPRDKEGRNSQDS